MDNSIILISISIGVIVMAGFAWAWGRNRISPDLASLLSEAVARLRAHLSYADTEAIVRLYAEEFYDYMIKADEALPRKVTQEWFVDFCVRAILGAQAKGAQDAETFGAMVVER